MAHVDTRPDHQKVAADIRAQIASGELPAGCQLPSTSQLIEQFGVANATVQKALTLLKDEGYLSSRRGKGVYVRDREVHVVGAKSYITPDGSYTYELLCVKEVVPPRPVGALLRLGEGEQAFERKRLMLYNDEPVELATSYYPSKIASGTPLARKARIKGGAPKVLADLGYAQKHMIDTTAARHPTTEEVELLRLPQGVPILRQLRLITATRDIPVEASVLIKPSHLYEVRFEADL
ncbi:hypothetical protein GCM10027447_01840 [Glycomyces halotolerans]